MFVFPSEKALIEQATKWAADKVAFFDREIDKLPSQRSQLRRRHVEARAAYADMHYLLTHYTIRPAEEVAAEEPASETA